MHRPHRGPNDILYVHPDCFDRGQSAEVAAAVARANDRLAREDAAGLILLPEIEGSRGDG